MELLWGSVRKPASILRTRWFFCYGFIVVAFVRLAVGISPGLFSALVPREVWRRHTQNGCTASPWRSPAPRWRPALFSPRRVWHSVGFRPGRVTLTLLLLRGAGLESCGGSIASWGGSGCNDPRSSYKSCFTWTRCQSGDAPGVAGAGLVTAPLGLAAPGLAALCSPAPGRFSSAAKLFIFQCS